jgi:hypothetical protein
LLEVAVGRCPQTGAPLASQSTISRLENAPSKTAAGRLSAALLDKFGATVKPGKLEVLDIDDTFCAAHGGQQLAFWNAHHDERGFACPARTPKGSEVCTVIKHVTKRLRRHWPNTRLVWRGDSRYGRVEAMDWAEEHGADYIFCLAGNAALDTLVAETAVNLRFYHVMSSKPKLRTYVSFLYQAGSWRRPRKVVARLECSLQPVAGSTGMRQEDRRVLADAWRARRYPAEQSARQGRVRDHPGTTDQDRRARDRASRPHPRSAADELSGGRAVPHRRARPDAVRPIGSGAVCPAAPPTWQINPERVAQRVASYRPRRTERRHTSVRLTRKKTSRDA